LPDFTIQDSSRPGKISYHVIFGNVVFDDIHCMRNLLVKAVLGLNKEELDKNMMYYHEYHEILRGIDYAIYTRDRCFRFCYSRKHMNENEADSPE
jgi:hypothetical protein